MNNYDLHVHTTASDGLLSPAEVILHARHCGLRGIAITDHDTVSGLRSLARPGDELQLISGIEINTDYQNQEVHILGYFIDVENPELLQRLEKIKQARLERAVKIIDRLQELGLQLTLERIRQIAGAGPVGRPHIARAMIEQGYVDTYQAAFETYLGRGCPAYIPRYRLLPQEAISLIKKAGGITVLAHPGLVQDQTVIESVIRMGIDGLEVFYPEHTQADIEQFWHLARKSKLVVTGGSDFHGTEKTRNQLGRAGINDQQFAILLDIAGISRHPG